MDKLLSKVSEKLPLGSPKGNSSSDKSGASSAPHPNPNSSPKSSEPASTGRLRYVTPLTQDEVAPVPTSDLWWTNANFTSTSTARKLEQRLEEQHDQARAATANEVIPSQTTSTAGARSTSQAPTTLPDWPPTLSESQRKALVELMTSWALAHGFTLLPRGTTDPPSAAIPAPMSLFPTPFPALLYDRALSVQKIYNGLYARISMDWEFLDGIMTNVARVDSFQARLWRAWQYCRESLVQPLSLGIFRSDYLLHSNSPEEPLDLKQVEFNTVSSSFGALSSKASQLHGHVANSTGYYGCSPLLESDVRLTASHPLHDIAGGLASAWKAYGNPKAVVLFVVQEGERNLFDQRLLEFELMDHWGAHSARYTFKDLERLAQVRQRDKALYCTSKDGTNTASEVAVVYYRAGYTPNDYPTEAEWNTRIYLEQSRAIKCPSLAVQLSGAKKIQQVLAEPGVLEAFVLGKDQPDVNWGAVMDDGRLEEIRKTFIGLWPMDDSTLGQEGVRLAMSEPSRFVLKPQREGGGNNIYRENIPPLLRELEEESKKTGERNKKEAYILMELIKPPTNLSNWLLKSGETEPRETRVISELGVYGVMLFPDRQVSQRDGSSKASPTINEVAGTLLRTKASDSDEGGVAIGISSIDSPLLII